MAWVCMGKKIEGKEVELNQVASEKDGEFIGILETGKIVPRWHVLVGTLYMPQEVQIK